MASSLELENMDAAMQQLQTATLAMQKLLEEQAQQQARLTKYVQQAEQQRPAPPPPARGAPTQSGTTCGIDGRVLDAQTHSGRGKTWLESVQMFVSLCQPGAPPDFV